MLNPFRYDNDKRISTNNIKKKKNIVSNVFRSRFYYIYSPRRRPRGMIIGGTEGAAQRNRPPEEELQNPGGGVGSDVFQIFRKRLFRSDEPRTGHRGENDHISPSLHPWQWPKHRHADCNPFSRSDWVKMESNNFSLKKYQITIRLNTETHMMLPLLLTYWRY